MMPAHGRALLVMVLLSKLPAEAAAAAQVETHTDEAPPTRDAVSAAAGWMRMGMLVAGRLNEAFNDSRRAAAAAASRRGAGRRRVSVRSMPDRLARHLVKLLRGGLIEILVSPTERACGPNAAPWRSSSRCH